MSSTAKPPSPPAQSANGEAWDAIYNAFLQGNQQAFARWMRATVALTQEVAQFTQNRLQEDMAAWSTLAACRRPDEALECQRRFTSKAAEQYSAEIAKLAQMLASAAKEDAPQAQ